jgi:hypothetical protein
MLAHLRNNAVAYLALFAALSSTAVAAAALEDNSVLSKHIKDGAVRKVDIRKGAVDSSRVKDGSLAPVDRVPGFGSGFAAAGHNHDARYVNEGQLDAVGAGMITDTQRSVSVPLGSFNDCQTSGTEINFASAGDDRADFVIVQFTDLRLRFDDDPGDEDTEKNVCSGITVPPDYVSAVGLRASVSKDADTGPLDEQLVGKVGSDPVGADIAGSAEASVVLALPSALNPGQVLGIRLSVRNGSGDQLNDTVDIHAIDFVYRSKQ